MLFWHIRRYVPELPSLVVDGKTINGTLTSAAIQTNNYLKKPAKPALPYIGYGRDYLYHKPIN